MRTVTMGLLLCTVPMVSVAASLCDEGGQARVEAVEMSGASVSAIEVRNVGTAPGNVSGLEVVVAGAVRGSVADYLSRGEAAIHRLAFPSNVQLEVGQVISISLRGSYEYKQAHAEWPDFELPVRGGEPEVANMRVAGGLSRLGAAPEVVALVCVAAGRDLDTMAVRGGLGRVQAPPWIPPRAIELPTEGAPQVEVELMVAPSPRVERDGVVTYVVHVRPQTEALTPVQVFLELPDGLVFDEWLSTPSRHPPLGPPSGEAPFFDSALQGGEPLTWVVRARFDPSAPPVGRLRATARAAGGDKDVLARVAFVAVPEADAPTVRTGAPQRAVELSDKGQVGVFTRAFAPDDNPVTQDINVGVDARVQADVSHGPFKERARVYALADATDRRRNAIFVEEAYLAWKQGEVRLVAGAVTANTSRLDTFHPADVINARFLDSEIENPAKIGEPMVTGRFGIPRGAITGYFMPWFTAPRLASPRSRFNANPGVELGPPLFLLWSGAATRQRLGVQWGVNIEQTYGPVDLAVQYLRHQDRQQPLFVVVPGEDAPSLLILPVSHVGFNYNQAAGSTVLKGEAAWRRFGAPEGAPRYLQGLPDRDHFAMAAGLEYSFGIGNLTLAALLEGQAIVLEGPDDPQVRQSLTPFQRDLLVGTRITFNDRANRSLIVLSIVDLETGDEMFGGIRYGQRLDEHWTIAASVRTILAPEPGPAGPQTGLQSLRTLDFVNVLFSRHF